MAVKSLYRPIEDPAAELAAVKENLRKRQSPIATMTILAGITFIFLIIVHVVEVINMNLCQYAFYFLIFFLAVACTIYLVILMIPLKDKTASLVLLYVLSFCFAVSYVMTAATYHVGVSILSYLLTIFYVVCVIFVANTIAKDITEDWFLLIIYTAINNLLLVPALFIAGAHSEIPIFLFFGAVFSFIFASLYVFVNCQYCGLYVGKKTKVRQMTIDNIYEVQPVAYLYVGSISIAMHFQPIIHQLWKGIDGTW